MLNKKGKILLIASLCALVLPISVKAQTPEFTKQMDAYLNSDSGAEKIMEAIGRYNQKKQTQKLLEEGRKAKENYDKYFSIGKSPVKGKNNAKVTVVAISDFQCPYCSKGAQIMDEVTKAYPNDVKLVFKNLPLGFHPEAKPAAIAALAAKEQGKFWEMHDLIFQNQGELSGEKYLELAKALKLNMKKFEQDLKSPKLAKQVDDDAEMAGKLGVGGTPGFFVNGIAVRGAQPVENFKALIDEELAKSKGGKK